MSESQFSLAPPDREMDFNYIKIVASRELIRHKELHQKNKSLYVRHRRGVSVSVCARLSRFGKTLMDSN